MALDELKEYLQDNPQSDLNKALEIQKKKGEMAYLVALHYAATPSYTFVRDNAKEFGIKNTQAWVEDFKDTMSEVTGRPLVKHAQSKAKIR